ncbi:Acetyltransferase (GNAT) family protein [Marinomonas spartinae]|uniref:Acetyltransferase (GNAT) family protein n=1 Tax=Marinomonas spartinae TaxID=1792290 RepID=A0A1A8TU32_9GAMM|nr:GNAT family N-acetyltransferase [Marinomonas spartinae]SBS36658.1 Acetyltransferase (GNAT) family protein [Marinomonas spartinae]
MNIEYRFIDVETDYETCYEFRKDAYFCSFATYQGFETFIEGYKERLLERIHHPDWFYFHLWYGGRIIGQLEFRCFSTLKKTGYLHLIYLAAEYRGMGLAGELERFIAGRLMEKGCQYCLLSVSRSNQRTLIHYAKFGWHYDSPNPKHDTTDFYLRVLSE